MIIIPVLVYEDWGTGYNEGPEDAAIDPEAVSSIYRGKNHQNFRDPHMRTHIRTKTGDHFITYLTVKEVVQLLQIKDNQNEE